MKHLVVAAVLGIVCWQLVVLIDPKGLDLMTIYYDDEDQPVPMLTNVTQVVPTLKTRILRFGVLPCDCLDYTCGCCANMNIRLFNFERHACMNLTYDPYEFSIGMNMLMNEESIYQQSVSAKNPPPACVPMPVPYLPSIDFCVRFFEIYTPGGNLHMCINFESRIERVPVMVLQFDCVKMGVDGVNLLKPDEEAEEEIQPPEKEDVDQASDVFDEVNEIKKNGSFPEVNGVKKKGSLEHTGVNINSSFEVQTNRSSKISEAKNNNTLTKA